MQICYTAGSTALPYHFDEVWLLTLYAKSEHATIPAHELRLIREAIERE